MLRKIVSGIMLTLLFIGMLTLAFNVQPAEAGTINPTIQQAINAASPGDTIFVKAGIYREHIEINKTISLIGEDPTNTIIDGDGLEYIPILLISEPNVTVANFTVRNTSKTVETYGILISKTQNVSFTGVTLKETYCGIMLHDAYYCKVFDSRMLENYAYGVSLRSNSSNNNFVGNTIMENPTGVYIADLSCQNNMFYHNNFINNKNQASNFGTNTAWDNGYPSGGNYWSDYTGVDEYSGPYQNETGMDKIGDTPYTESFGVNDTYPLMNFWGAIPPIADFTYSPEKPVKNETITFDASASYDPDGNIISYKWDFGDGNITVVKTPTIMHSYLDCGDYSVTLKVTDNSNLTDTVTKIITVQKRISTLSIDAHPTTVTVGSNITITGKLKPALEGASITISYQPLLGAWKILTIVETDSDGNSIYSWTTTEVGMYILNASWTGDEQTLGSQNSTGFISVNKISSNITISIEPATATVGSNITISGTITPSRANANVTIQFRTINGTNFWNITIQTDANGHYQYIWTPSNIGTYEIKASWQGDDKTLPAESETKTVNVEAHPTDGLLLAIIAIAIIILAAILICFLKIRKH
ncbi:Ig-like domain repeat protein [Candidatus Bathyarchaeota archaeon]|nr:Ig-like domain repeat protein [Candidatus Bathyarchaeota archaeon]